VSTAKHPRWRVVENVVAAIQQVIGHDAGWTVTQNAAVAQRDSSRRRQVDVYLECPSGPEAFRVAIDVKSSGRALDLEEIEQLCAKAGKLQVDRYVIVSVKGYTEAAEEHMRLQGITGMTLQTMDIAAVTKIPQIIHVFAVVLGVVLVYKFPGAIGGLVRLGNCASQGGLMGVSIDFSEHDVAVLMFDGTRQSLSYMLQHHAHGEMQRVLLGDAEGSGLVTNVIKPHDDAATAVFEHAMFTEQGSPFRLTDETNRWEALNVDGKVYPPPLAMAGRFRVEVDDEVETHRFSTHDGSEIVSSITECVDGVQRQFVVMRVAGTNDGCRLAVAAVDAVPKRRKI